MSVTVTSFSLSVDSLAEMGGVIPRYLGRIEYRVNVNSHRLTHYLRSCFEAMVVLRCTTSCGRVDGKVDGRMKGRGSTPPTLVTP